MCPHHLLGACFVVVRNTDTHKWNNSCLPEAPWMDALAIFSLLFLVTWENRSFVTVVTPPFPWRLTCW